MIWIPHAMQGTIFNIQRFSIHDGPGIRTTVFFKGCNLRCLWCHNPESASRAPEVEFYPDKCIACGACVEICPADAQELKGNGHEPTQRLYHRDLCRLCFQCIQECFSGALLASGKEVDTAQVMDEIERDQEYYRFSRGGVTFSGGEPLLQVDFLKSLLVECRQRGIHCAVDTAGNVAWELLEAIIPLTDLFLFDVKGFDEETHRRATGAGNQRILENLTRLSTTGSEIWIRIPVIPGINDSPAEIEQIAGFLAPLPGIRWVELLPFHSLGSEKYPSLGREYPMKGVKPPSKEKMTSLLDLFDARGLPARIMN
jgi:pyruvate formate lyase activating enzyme